MASEAVADERAIAVRQEKSPTKTVVEQGWEE